MPHDAVVIGSGPNGLVAANLLVDAGWDVLVLEEQDGIGGAVTSDSGVRDGWVHDVCSSFYPLAAGSPTIQALDLESHGLVWEHAPAVLGTPFADGSWAVLHREREDTAAGLEADHPGDGDAWLEMCKVWDRIGDQVVGALLSPFPPVKHGIGATLKLPSSGGLGFVQQMLSPARSVAEERFGGREGRNLFGGLAGHADIPLTSPGSGTMGWLLGMLGQAAGFPVPRGGAGMLTRAMAERFRAQGGEIRTGTRVDRVLVHSGRATGVRTADGEEHPARRAVLADVSAPALYGDLVPWSELPAKVRRRMGRFEWDPGTVKVDWALDAPIPWKSAPPAAPGTIHLAEDLDEIAAHEAQVTAGLVPARPFMLLGQMATTDATRAPVGAESIWAYTHVPQEVRGDAAHAGITGAWGHDDLERMADRMQDRLVEYAPAFADHIVGRRILGPHELEAHNANLVGGAINGGTAQLQQQLVFRPFPGRGRAETPVRGLYLASSSAHPGGGVHGACGSNAARAALFHARVRRLWPA